MKYIKLGPWETSNFGLGVMPLSIENRPDKDTSIAVIHRAIDAGINHIDAAFAYYLSGGTAQNGEEQYSEKLVAEALRTYTGSADINNVTVASKAGHYRYVGLNDEKLWGQEGNPRYIYETGLKSRDALEMDSIDLYYYHRPDLNTKYELSIEALAKLIDDNVIKFAGISNASTTQIDIAKSILGDKLIAVQNQFSPAKTATIDTLNYCNDNGLTFIPWSPLGGFRHPELFDKDAPFEEIASKYNISKQQVILAWEMQKNTMPIPGFRRFETLDDSLKALSIDLSSDDISFLDKNSGL
ncbi:MAG: aldo/keto reductase [Bifidobacteriaceae bacterium]|jgi:aryl-alcohol dehydrogenase-like predicted oxidoreductase|nr:aldo/keto reductase [Bifidobacteriaceae bacterium]